MTLKASIAQGIDRGEIPERSQGEAGKSATLTLGTYGYLFPDRLDEVSKKGAQAAIQAVGQGEGQAGED
ncbi:MULTISPECIES: hypothetical protein [unclassified Streptomyces]|uniref:hypothetical protein n=1 Tax=unclassified Streptomyces TaxID=2593676 RepID=UPI002365287F|nr:MULTISPECIES: hypothetical protein [unclassified Streptomyces]MDF3141714.1 hypothetical protein [Streptomyces sp. T21Q-yed]WDF38902.1 hypothetical protein PBV52_19895 [Streptomyces sp. T12]